MQNPSHKHSPSTAQSLSPLVLSCSSLWNSGDQAKCSSAKGIAAGCGSSPSLSDHMKQSESQFQEQDSSSTLSTCQSLYAMGNTARNNSMVQNHGSKHGNAPDTYFLVHWDYKQLISKIYLYISAFLRILNQI